MMSCARAAGGAQLRGQETIEAHALALVWHTKHAQLRVVVTPWVTQLRRRSLVEGLAVESASRTGALSGNGLADFLDRFERKRAGHQRS